MGRLESDGRPAGGTRVFCEDGTEIKEVVAVRWEHASADSIPTLDVTVGLYAIDAAGELKVLCGHPTEGGVREVRRIEFADGSEWAAS